MIDNLRMVDGKISPPHVTVSGTEIRAKEVILVTMALCLLICSILLFFKHWKKNYRDINQLPYYAYLYKKEAASFTHWKPPEAEEMPVSVAAAATSSAGAPSAAMAAAAAAAAMADRVNLHHPRVSRVKTHLEILRTAARKVGKGEDIFLARTIQEDPLLTPGLAQPTRYQLPPRTQSDAHVRVNACRLQLVRRNSSSGLYLEPLQTKTISEAPEASDDSINKHGQLHSIVSTEGEEDPSAAEIAAIEKTGWVQEAFTEIHGKSEVITTV